MTGALALTGAAAVAWWVRQRALSRLLVIGAAALCAIAAVQSAQLPSSPREAERDARQKGQDIERRADRARHDLDRQIKRTTDEAVREMQRSAREAAQPR